MITLAAAPSYTDQLQGWGTLAGALITAGLLVYEVVTGRQARREAFLARIQAGRERREAARDRERLDAERRDAEMAQARLVVLSKITIGTTRLGVGSIAVTLANYSAAPVLEVDVTAHFRSDDTTVDLPLAAVGILPPGGNLPAERSPVPEMHGKPPFEQVRHEALAKSVEIAVTFTDAAGLRWRRTGRVGGTLSTQPERVTD